MVIQQHSRKLLMMDMLMSEICWVHKKWDKIASDIKLVFHSSTITAMHGPINIKFWNVESRTSWPETKTTQTKFATTSNKNEQKQDAENNAELYTEWTKTTWKTF